MARKPGIPGGIVTFDVFYTAKNRRLLLPSIGDDRAQACAAAGWLAREVLRRHSHGLVSLFQQLRQSRNVDCDPPRLVHS
jgi:hypothetical protein